MRPSRSGRKHLPHISGSRATALAKKGPIIQEKALAQCLRAKYARRPRVRRETLAVCLVSLQKLFKAHTPKKLLGIELDVPSLGSQLSRLS